MYNVGVRVLIHHGQIVGNSPAEEHIRHQAICHLDNNSQLPANILNVQVCIIILILYGLQVSTTYDIFCHTTNDPVRFNDVDSCNCFSFHEWDLGIWVGWWDLLIQYKLMKKLLMLIHVDE